MVQIRIHVVDSDSVDAYIFISDCQSVMGGLRGGDYQAAASHWHLNILLAII